MKPYYSHDGVELYNCDCAELLDSTWCDLLVTDPPYGIEYRSNHRTERHAAIAGDDELPLAKIEAALARTRRAAYVFARWDTVPLMPAPKSLLVWVKNNWSMGDLEHEHGRQWEAICFYAKPEHEFTKRIPDVLYVDRTDNALHPTQKPVALLRQLIRANVGDVVFDPFAGSGSTLAAAWLEHRKAIGCEIEERYCEVIATQLTKLQYGGLFRSAKG